MYNTPPSQRLFAGLVDKGVEFFVHQNDVKCIAEGKTFRFEDFPAWILDIVNDDMMKHPEAIKALAEWENLHPSDYVRQYIYCRFGGADTEPDINDQGEIQHSEYFDCGLRGQCRFEGKLCCNMKVDNGSLTKSEMEVLKRVNLPDKIIADQLCISSDTVNSHLQNIRKKTGLTSKIELAVFAAKKGII